jgi:predicted DNA-binding antitoxin AbrB/MazE fold protein
VLGGATSPAAFLFLSCLCGSRHFVAAAPAVYYLRTRRLPLPPVDCGDQAMTTIIKATYVQGVFRPQEPIALVEGTQVELTLRMPPEQPTEESRGARLLREAAQSHAAVVAGSGRFLESLGIRGEPTGAKALRERMIAEGIHPEGNEFSREIIAMREE